MCEYANLQMKNANWQIKKADMHIIHLHIRIFAYLHISYSPLIAIPIE